jgi:hexosaminidase
MTPGAYIHIGGDEALGMDPELYSRFMQRARKIGYEVGKKIVAWQETARSGFAPEDIAQIWLEPSVHDLDAEEEKANAAQGEPTPEEQEVSAAFGYAHKVAPLDLGKIIEQGSAILMSLGPVAYFDTRYREPSANPSQEGDRKTVGAPFYTSRTVEDFYTWDPGTIKPEVDASRIVGVEGAIWCESVESVGNLFFLLLPRLPGLLEKGWSSAMPQDTAWSDYAPRLAAHDTMWDRLGLPYFRSSGVWPNPA